MPCHLISEALKWMIEIPTVPLHYLAKPQKPKYFSFRLTQVIIQVDKNSLVVDY